MKQENDWNPEAKFGLSMALHGPPWPSNHSKLTENTIGELSVKSQLTTHHYHKAMAIQWHQSPTRGFDRVKRKLPQKPDLPVLKEVQCGI